MRECLDENIIMDVIEFGRYWEGTGMENIPIQWLVLEETDEYLFVVSNECVIFKEFDDKTANWEKSTIRQWLNDKFIQLAFAWYEKASILNKEIVTLKGQYLFDYKEHYTRTESVATTDKVFLLGIDEVEKFFKTEKSRIAKSSAYAIETLKDKEYANAWWLRNEAYDYNLGVWVSECGTYLLPMSECVGGVRPAMYIRRDYHERIPMEGQLQMKDFDATMD